jgi:hypothetical protein
MLAMAGSFGEVVVFVMLWIVVGGGCIGVWIRSVLIIAVGIYGSVTVHSLGGIIIVLLVVLPVDIGPVVAIDSFVQRAVLCCLLIVGLVGRISGVGGITPMHSALLSNGILPVVFLVGVGAALWAGIVRLVVGVILRPNAPRWHLFVQKVSRGRVNILV